MSALGFVTPAEFDELAGDLFYSSFSFEEMGRLDRDVLVWISGDPAINDQIRANPLREQLAAVAEGRELRDQLQAGAFSFSSPLSIPYLLETLVPQLEAAADGDPATEVPVGA
jgi:iron complex transport system substrate-binding protein